MKKLYWFFKYMKNYSIIKFIYYNYFSKHVHRNNGYLLLAKNVFIEFGKDSQIVITNGKLKIGDPDRAVSHFELRDDSKICCNGDFVICYGADVILDKGAELLLGTNSFINGYLFVRSRKRIKIGSYCAISSYLTMYDNDGHILNGANESKEITIEDNVWIGTKCTLLKNCCIRQGSVIGANSLVISEIPEKCLAYGSPAIIRKKNIKWEI